MNLHRLGLARGSIVALASSLLACGDAAEADSFDYGEDEMVEVVEALETPNRFAFEWHNVPIEAELTLHRLEQDEVEIPRTCGGTARWFFDDGLVVSHGDRMESCEDQLSSHLPLAGTVTLHIDEGDGGVELLTELQVQGVLVFSEAARSGSQLLLNAVPDEGSSYLLFERGRDGHIDIEDQELGAILCSGELVSDSQRLRNACFL